MHTRLPLPVLLFALLVSAGCNDDSNDQGAYCDALCARTDECGLLTESQCLSTCGRDGDAQCINDVDRDACIDAIRS